MDKQQAAELIKNTFEHSFEKDRFAKFASELLNGYEPAPFVYKGNIIHHAFSEQVASFERLGKYHDADDKRIDILIVHLKKDHSVGHARTMQRNFVAGYLKGNYGRTSEKAAALVAFVSPKPGDWRFSLVKMDTVFDKSSGRPKPMDEFTPARRWSFLVGENERSHTAQSRLVPILAEDENNPTLAVLEEAFSIESVTKEFFIKYRDLFIRTKEALDKTLNNDKAVKDDFDKKGANTVDFAKKLLGQIVFLYFLQKKGWFGVPKNGAWGSGSKQFLRELFEKKHGSYINFFNDILEPLFYEALRIGTERESDDYYYSRFNCKIPFLNGGLFDPIFNYDWVNTDILLPNALFSNNHKTQEGDIGDGILDIFDRYNFTVKEDEPLEKEVAIDPELLGKAYEKFNAIRPDNFNEYKMALKTGEEGKFNKKFGVYYTPREIVHYMCQQSLINYLFSGLNGEPASYEIMGEKNLNLLGNQGKRGQLDITVEHKANPEISKEDIETLILHGESIKEHEDHINEKGGVSRAYPHKMPQGIRDNAKRINELLADIKVCDPAVGSGAFPVGMMSEIVKLRCIIDKKKKKTAYEYKRQCIENSLYGVDIDSGAVEIAKLRLWLSLVVDENEIKQIKPLPNLDYKIVCGNSLLEVEKNIFNNELFIELEKYKSLYFNETKVGEKKSYKKKIDDLIVKIKSGHIEFDYEIYFSEVFHYKNGFDIVIANPPYIGEKGNETIFHAVQVTVLGNKYYTRWMDYFYYFIHKSLDIVRPAGFITFITTNYYLTATGAYKLRTDIKERSSIVGLINFNELKIFESAQGQHNIITNLLKIKDETIVANTFVTNRVGFATQDILNIMLAGKDKETSHCLVTQNNLFEGLDNQIRIMGKNIDNNVEAPDIFSKIKQNSVPLGAVCHIIMGLVSRADRVSNNHFKIDSNLSAKKGDGIFVLTNAELHCLSLSKLDKENYIRPFYKNSDINKYYTKTNNDLWLLYIKDEGVPIKLPVAIENHFERFENLLTKLKKNFLKNKIAANFVKKWLKNGNYFVLFNPKEEYYFTQPKIVAPYRSTSNNFAYNEIPWYASQDVCYIWSKCNEQNLKYLLSFLNSKLCLFWLQNKGKRKGKIIEFYQKPLSDIPIKQIKEQQQKPMIEVVNKIISLTKSNDYLINVKKQEKVKGYEAQIDFMVYKLYDLTHAEVKIVDPDFALTEKEYEAFSI